MHLRLVGVPEVLVLVLEVRACPLKLALGDLFLSLPLCAFGMGSYCFHPLDFW